jgi:hypothetical protein
MEKFSVKVLKPLIEATNDSVEIIKDLNEAKPFFFIENIRILPEWQQFYETLKFILKANQDFIKITTLQVSRFCFYFDLVSEYMLHNGRSDQDIEYANAVDSFFVKYRRQTGKRDKEKMFWKAFPDVKRKAEN